MYVIVAKKRERKYWGNPQVYITSGIQAAPHDTHFVLHDFKTNELQPLSANLKGVDLMGELRYQVRMLCRELP